MVLKIILAVVLLPVLFLVIWCSTCALIAACGWNKLAFRNTAFSPPEGEKISGQSIRLSLLANYKGCITFHVSKSGLHMSVMKIFRVGHPPLFFPWSAVRYCRDQDTMLGKRHLYDLGSPRVGRVAVSPKVHRTIQYRQSGH